MSAHNEWWRGAVIYQVYPRSFMDANGDGVGDLKGVTQRMGYLADLGVDVVWLSPINTSPMDDFGYDVSNYLDIDPLFGSMADFDAMLAEAHRLGIKVIIDQVLSHTSDQHPWFIESRSSRDNPKADWYVWADPKPDGTPPNNWLSVFGGVSWEWDSRRGQYYLHNFLKSQPDLNYHNPEVRKAVLDVLKFWLDKGLDGFRLDVVNFYYHDKNLHDNPPQDLKNLVVSDPKNRNNPHVMQQHIYDKMQPENLDFLKEMRALCDAYSPDRMLVGELSVRGKDTGAALESYTTDGQRLHMAYVFELLNPLFSADHIREVTGRLHREVATGWTCWSLGNHDNARVVSRWGVEKDAAMAAPCLTALMLSLRGSACLYEGEELGLPEADIPYELLQDPYGITLWPEYKGRDGCRTPMPWEKDAENAGFGKGKPWLPIPDSHRALAVDVQDKDPDSILSRTKKFINWRKGMEILRLGDMSVENGSGEVFIVRRSLNGKEMLCAFNLGNETVEFALPAGNWTILSGHGFGGELQGGNARIKKFDALFCEQ